MSGFSENYGGCQIFLFLTNWTGLPLDQVNFIVTQLFALFLAPLYRTLLHPARVEAHIRHGLGLFLGVTFTYICFGWQIIHMVALSTLSYIIMTTLNPNVMQRVVLVVSLLYLSIIHLYRQFYYYHSYTLDISGPLMIAVQKITSLAFSLHDGITKDPKEMTESQKYYALYSFPTPFEYYSYIFHHQTIMAGPLIFYKDYIHFIQGAYLIHKKPTSSSSDTTTNNRAELYEPSPRKAVITKSVGATICAVAYLKLSTVYPVDIIKEDTFVLNTSLLYKFWYLSLVTTLARFKYYYAWLFSDAVCNNSGLGFNGYDSNGTPKWDGVSNIDVFKFEFSTSLRESIAAWNMQTNTWLRIIVYERVNKYQTVLTYGLSALWHGFYLGYYLTFASGALFTMASRAIRRTCRDYFQTTRYMSIFYDVLTCLATRILFGYLTFSFVILDFWPSMRIYLHMYLCLHILAILAIVILPRLKRTSDSKKSNSTNNKKNKKSKIDSGISNSKSNSETAINGVIKHHEN